MSKILGGIGSVVCFLLIASFIDFGINDIKIGDYEFTYVPGHQTNDQQIAETSEIDMLSFNYDEESLSCVALEITTTEGEMKYGSAVIIEKIATTYTIITNYHVIENFETISVVIEDNEQLTMSGTVTKYNQASDLALIQFTTIEDYPVVEFANDVIVGQTAYAIGTSLNLSYYNSLSTGIVSGEDRTIEGNQGTFVQHSATLVPGNSGGALFNAYGQLIGINTLRVVSNSDTIYFSIDLDSINAFLES